MLKPIRTMFKKLIETIATQNKKSFGDQKLDCCELSKGQKPSNSKDK